MTEQHLTHDFDDYIVTKGENSFEQLKRFSYLSSFSVWSPDKMTTSDWEDLEVLKNLIWEKIYDQPTTNRPH